MKQPAVVFWFTIFLLSFRVSLGGERHPGETVPRDSGGRQAPEIGADSSLEDYLRYAALENAGLKAAFNRWKAALERVPQVGALPDPRFTYTFFVEEVETRVGPQRQKFGLTQAFPWFGKLDARKDAASEAAAAAGEAYRTARLALFYRVKSAYHDYWYLARAIDLTRQHIMLMKNLEGVARTRFKTGVATNSAVIQAQVELAKLDDRLRSREALREAIVARLNAAMNRPAGRPLPWPRLLPESDAALTDGEAAQWLAEGNPELRRLDRLSAAEEAGIRLARKEYFPDIRLGVGYVQTDDALAPGTPDSGKDPVTATVSINLPIWYGKQRAAGREARLRQAAAESKRDDTAARLAADLQLALYHFRDAERKIDLYGDTLVPKAEQSLKVAQQGFEAGTATFLSLIDAERLLLEFELDRARARAERGTRLAEIEMLVGRDIAQ